jgi:outer membrane immunogenic protein
MNKLSIMSVMMAMGMTGIAHAHNENWTGFYAGVNAGVTFNHAQLKSQHPAFTNPDDTCNTSSNFSTFFPGIQLGYMQQLSSQLVAGVEANATINTNQNHTLGCTSSFNPGVYDRFTVRNQLQSSIKGLVGRALQWNNNRFLPYLTAGASFAHLGLTYKNEGGEYYSANTMQAGWLIGAGVEWAFRQNWSVRVEYFYADYGDAIKLQIPNVYNLIDTNGSAHVDLSSSNVVIAINYWM